MDKCVKCGQEVKEGEVCTCTCAKCKDIIFDPVLAYCWSFLQTYSVAEVAKSVESFFTSDDIIKARNILRNEFMDKLGELEISTIAYRKSSIKRTCVGANAYDVTEATYLLTRDGGPKFVTDDISRLPVIGPNLTNHSDQSASLLMMENRLRRMEEKMDVTQSTLVEHDEVLKEHDQMMRECNKKSKDTADSSAPDLGSLSLPPAASGFGWSRREMQRSEQSSDQAPASGKLDRKDGNPEPSSVAAAPSKSSWSHVASQLRTDSATEEPWHVVRNKQKVDRMPSKPLIQRKRPAPMQGTAVDTNIKAGKGPKRDLWIYNVHRDMSDEDLRKYIEDGGSQQERKVNIRLWEPRYKDFHEYKCFRLTISKTDYDYVYKPEFWPMDIHFRKYWLDKAEIDALKGKVDTSPK